MSREKSGWLRSFLKSDRGNIAMMFALAIVPLMIGAGVGLDYARAMLVRQQMTEALDAAALAIGAGSGLSQADAQALAQKYFDANYTVDKTVYGSPAINIPTSAYNSKGSVTITATNNMPTVLVKLIGIASLPVTASSNVIWGQTKLWVALVLDNSASMNLGDSGGTKLAALKTAASQLLSILKNASAKAGDVQVSIVPFGKGVRVGTGTFTASAVDWTNWDCPPQKTHDYANCVDKLTVEDAVLHGHPLKTFGPGDKCPFDGSRGYICAPVPANDSNCSAAGGPDCPTVLPIPSSGPYSGYICPSMNAGYGQSSVAGHFYNGCWIATSNTGNFAVIGTGSSANCDDYASGHCGCATVTSVYQGYPAGTFLCVAYIWNMSWVVNSHTTWTGCLMDRDQNNDIANTTPGTGTALFPAENNSICGKSAVAPLGYDWDGLSSQINAMVADASTNQAIGIAHGWQTLTPGSPYGATPVPDNTTRYMIILSDGQNTIDRWWGDGTTENTVQDGYIDARQKLTCDAAKADGIVIYSVYVHVNDSGGLSNSAPLRYCATDATKYFSLTTTGSISVTLQQIGQEISNLRVVK